MSITLVNNIKLSRRNIDKLNVNTQHRRLNGLTNGLQSYERLLNTNIDKSCYKLRKLADNADLPHIRSAYENQIVSIFKDVQALVMQLSKEDEDYLGIYRMTIMEDISDMKDLYKITF